MPRNPQNKNEFIAGALPIVTIKLGKSKEKSYYVDGRLQQLRNVKDFMDSIDCVDDDVWELLSKEDRKKVIYEFMGEVI